MFSCLSSCCSFSSNQRTLTNPRHCCNLPVCLPLFQKGQRKPDLLRRELLRSAVFEVGILSCGGLAGLGALYDHAPFVFGKGQHHGQNQVAGQGVLNQSHIQDVDSDPTLEQLPDGLNTLDCGSGKAVKFAYHQRVPFLKLFQKPQELGAIHCLAGECLLDDLLAAVTLQCSDLILQAVPVPALGGGGYSCVM